ncbi:MAG: hypothetical protein DRN57_06410 [Thermoplasmata archaeon]|nr:MAG: hypothetical protein DRN57_06410 [Thermoplasmata archaeon]
MAVSPIASRPSGASHSAEDPSRDAISVIEGLKLVDYIDMTNSIFVILDENGIVRLANDRCLEMLEAGKEEVLGRNWFEEFIPPSERSAVKEVFGKMLRGDVETARKHQNGILTTTGRVRTIKWLNSFVKDEEGRIRFLIGSGEDVTESIEARKRLEDSERKFRLLAENQRDVVFSIKPDMTLEYLSPAAREFGGYAPEEEVGENVLKYFADPGEFEKALENIEVMGREGRSASLEIMYRPAEGDPFPVEITGKPVFGEGGELSAIHCVMRDVSRRKKIERELKFKREVMETLLEREEREAGLKAVMDLISRFMGATHIALIVRDGVDMKVASTSGFREDTIMELFSNPIGSLIRSATDRNEVFMRKVSGFKGLIFPSVKGDEVLYNIPLYNKKDLHICLMMILPGDVEMDERMQDAVRGIGVNIAGFLYRTAAKGREERARRRLELALEGAEMGFWELDIDTGELIVDDDYMSGSGPRIGREGMTWDVWEGMIHPEDRGDVLSLLHHHFDGGSDVFDAVFRLNTREDHPRWIRMKGKVVERRDDGTPTRISGTLQDVTAQREAELNLMRSEERFRSIFERSNLGIYRSSPDGRVLMANPALVRMLGFESLEELMKRDLNREGYDDPSERDLFKRRVEAEGEINEQEMVWKRKDGSDLIVNETARCVKDEEGNVLYYEGTVEDVTEKKRMEESLLETQRQLEMILESVQAGIVIIDAETNSILDANPRAREILGMELGDLIGRSCSDLTGSTEGSICSIADPGMKMEGVEKTITNCRGEKITILVTGTEIELEGRRALVNSFVDITNMKRAEEKMREGEERLKAITDASQDAIIMIDNEGRIIFWNPSAERIFGYTEAEILGKDLHQTIAPSRYHGAFMKAFPRFMETGEGKAIGKVLDMEALRKDGKEITIQLALSALKLNNRWHGVGTVRDITDKKKGEREVIRQKTYFESLFEESPEAIAILDLEERIVRVNRGFERLFGYTKEEVIGHYIDDLIAPDELRAEAMNLTNLVRDGETVYRETKRSTKYGKLFDVSLIGTPIRIGDDLEALYATYRDISQKKRAELAMIEAKERAEEAARMKSEFLANMSHEIRTPMNAILGFTEILERKITDPSQRVQLEAIRSSGKTLLRLINDILDLSKIEAGKLELVFTPTDPVSIVMDMERIFRKKTSDKGLELNTMVPDDVPKYLMMDEVRLRQVLLNLIGNAVKFTERGSITVGLESGTGKDDDAKMDISLFVEDTGIGIPPDEVDRIFGTFDQVKGQDSGKYGGTGLGLAISRKLVEMMGGTLSVTSTVGKGSRFQVFLPGVRVAEPEEDRDADTGFTERIVFRGSTILVVDDVISNRDLVKGYLEDHNINVLEADSGEECLNLVREYRPELVLVDIKMPGMDGWEVASRIRNEPQLSGTKLVAFTASIIVEDRSRLSEEGFDDLLIKPFSSNELVDLLSRHLPHEKMRVERTEQEADLPSSSNGNSDDLEGIDLSGHSVMKLVREAARTSSVDLIEKLGRELSEIAEKEGITALSNVSRDLLEAVASFDIDRMTSILSRLETMDGGGE